MINSPKALLRASALTLVIVAAMSVSQSVLAANWKSIGNDWYIDSESAKKYGDIGHITVRYTNSFETVSFDCKRRLLISPAAWADGKVINESVKRPNSKSVHKTKSWINFEDEEVVNLYQEALVRGEETLAQLIKIAAYTGARIEEICSLKKVQVNLQKNTIQVINAKTDAGNRVIPIHRELRKDLKNLLTNDIDEYVIPNLSFNKYGDRSNAVGKKFGRLKKLLGYGDRYVFHSIRKTVTTQLENANVNENITADILGHEKPRITYGQYSGGATLKVKEEVLNCNPK
jgi:integrase